MNPTRAANCLILILQAYIVRLATDDALVPVLIVGVVGCGFLLPRAWQLQTKRLLIATLALPWICLVKQQLYPAEHWLHAVGEWLLLTSSVFTIWGPLSFRGWRLGPLLAFGCGCCYFAACESGSMLSTHLRPLVIAHVLAFSICQNLQAVSTTDRYEKQTRSLMLALLVMVAAMGSWSLADLWADNAAQLQRWLNDQVTWASGRSLQQRGYVRIGQLDSVRKEQLSEPERVAIKVYANSAPGYLRGRVFDIYEQGHWRPRSRRRSRWNRHWANRTVQPMIVAPDGLPAPQHGDTQFALRPSRGPWLRYEIWNDPDRGEMFFTPLRSCYVYGIGSFIALDEHDVIYTGISFRDPYTVFVDRRAKDSLTTEMREQLLVPMQGADQSLIRQLAEQVCQNATTEAAKMSAIRSYFRDRYSYSLEPIPIPAAKDRLTYFLESRPAAHCEYFATATVALLRAQDIPARFATGYVVTELEDEYQDYWLARNRNAHAWAEAYDDERQKWVIVESTPNMPLLDEREEQVDEKKVTGTPSDESRLRMVRGGGLAARVSRGLTWLRRRMADPNTLLLLLAGCITILAWPRLKRHYALQRYPERVRLAESQRLLERVDRTTARFGFSRTKCETLHQFAHRIDAAGNDNIWLHSAAQWYRRYAEQRYASRLNPRDLRAHIPRVRSS